VETDRRFRHAHREGCSDPREKYAAEALVGMLTGAGKGHATAADLVLVCDLNDYRRGHGTGHIVAGRPLPVSVIREMSNDAFLKVVIHDGIQIHTVKHFGRYRKAELRTALELGDPPDFNGTVCKNCGNRYRLQWDHRDAVANGGPTTKHNLDGLCPTCHRQKTEFDRALGLLEHKYGKKVDHEPTQQNSERAPP